MSIILLLKNVIILNLWNKIIQCFILFIRIPFYLGFVGVGVEGSDDNINISSSNASNEQVNLENENVFINVINQPGEQEQANIINSINSIDILDNILNGLNGVVSLLSNPGFWIVGSTLLGVGLVYYIYTSVDNYFCKKPSPNYRETYCDRADILRVNNKSRIQDTIQNFVNKHSEEFNNNIYNNKQLTDLINNDLNRKHDIMHKLNPIIDYKISNWLHVFFHSANGKLELIKHKFHIVKHISVNDKVMKLLNDPNPKSEGIKAYIKALNKQSDDLLLDIIFNKIQNNYWVVDYYKKGLLDDDFLKQIIVERIKRQIYFIEKTDKYLNNLFELKWDLYASTLNINDKIMAILCDKFYNKIKQLYCAGENVYYIHIYLKKVAQSLERIILATEKIEYFKKLEVDYWWLVQSRALVKQAHADSVIFLPNSIDISEIVNFVERTNYLSMYRRVNERTFWHMETEHHIETINEAGPEMEPYLRDNMHKINEVIVDHVRLQYPDRCFHGMFVENYEDLKFIIIKIIERDMEKILLKKTWDIDLPEPNVWITLIVKYLNGVLFYIDKFLSFFW